MSGSVRARDEEMGRECLSRICSASLISRCLCINLHYMRSATQHNSTVCPVHSTLRSHWYAAFLWRGWSPVVAVTRRSEKECITTNLPSYLATWEGVNVHISTSHLPKLAYYNMGGEIYVFVRQWSKSQSFIWEQQPIRGILFSLALPQGSVRVSSRGGYLTRFG